MKVLDLFSGIGGFSLGLERAGMETVAFCEYDKKAQLVLKKHWPEIPIYDDVRELSGKQFKGRTIDLICGGFPCQPFSVAGKQKGDQDDRHLWPEYFRLIQEIRPRWVIGENVSGLINMGLDQVLSDLESENYSCQTLVIPACAVNAPHRRDRVWIIAHADQHSQPNVTLNGKQGCGELGEDVAHAVSNSERPTYRGDSGERSRERNEQNVSKRDEMGGHSGNSSKNVPNTISQRGCGRDTQRENAEDVRELPGGERYRHWDIEPSVGRVVDGIPTGLDGHFDREPDIPRVAIGIKNRSDRLRQLGNAVIPQVVEQIGRAIMQAEGL